MMQCREDLEAVARVPAHYSVRSRLDCGVRSLSAALVMLGIRPDLKVIGAALMPLQEGTSLSRVEGCARSFGLETLAVSLTQEQLSRVRQPAILHVKSSADVPSGDHFVLYTGSAKDGRIHIVDPPFFDKWFAYEDLAPLWDGTALVLSHTPLSESDLTSLSPKGWLRALGLACLLGVMGIALLFRLRRRA